MQKQDLVVGNTYTCTLSNLPILITEVSTPSKTVTNVRGVYFNSASGQYVSTNIYNNQLK
jgi:hypothetical protein